MADEPLGTPTEPTTGSDAPAAQPDNADTATAQTPPAGQPDNAAFAAARREAEAKLKAERKARETAEAELQKYRDEAQARADAELSEIDRVKKTAEEAAAKAADAEARLAAAELGRTRADLIAADPEAAQLPAPYKALVTGADEAALAESLAAAKAQFEADRAAILAAATGKPPALGTISNAPAQPTATPSAGEWSPENNTVDTWRKERERLGIGRVRI